MPTKIEWADETWNFISGCTPVSAACKICYAKRMAKRLGGRYGYPKNDPFRVTLHPDKIAQPLHWHKSKRIFMVSMGDLFHDDVFSLGNPFDSPDCDFALDSFVVQTGWDTLDAAFNVVARTPQHTYLILTKRPENMVKYFKAVQACNQKFADHFKNAPRVIRTSPAAMQAQAEANKLVPDNVHVGVTAENQEQADIRIPILFQLKNATRIVSVEPAVKVPNLRHYLQLDETNGEPEHFEKYGWGYDSWSGGLLEGDSCYSPGPGIHQVICGGGTGPGAEPIDPSGVRRLRDNCVRAETAFFFKHWGEYVDEMHPAAIIEKCTDETFVEPVRNYEGDILDYRGLYMCKVGRKAAGRELDGRTWDEFQEVLHG